jgi:hypothetical protein
MGNTLKRSSQMDATKTTTSTVIAHVAGAATAVLVLAAWEYFFPLTSPMMESDVRFVASLAVVAYASAYHLLTPSKTA